jgi:hypothetical protein
MHSGFIKVTIARIKELAVTLPLSSWGTLPSTHNQAKRGGNRHCGFQERIIDKGECTYR